MRTEWLADDEKFWRAYHIGDDLAEPAELVFNCPDCAEREFGGGQCRARIGESGQSAPPADRPIRPCAISDPETLPERPGNREPPFRP